MTNRGFGLPARWGVICALLVPTAARAQAPPAKPPPAVDAAARAVTLHDEAEVLYHQGKYREAIGKLETALELDPGGKELVYNLALIHEKLGEIDAAETAYRRYLTMEPDPKQRERVRNILTRIEGARQDIHKVAVDPAPPPPPPVTPPPVHTSPWPYAAGAVSAGALLTGGIFGCVALAKNPGSTAKTGAGVTIEDLRGAANEAHRDAVVADVGFVVGTLAAGAAVVLFLTSRTRSPALEPAPAPQPLGFVTDESGHGALQVVF